jgi:mRNA interferase RelE/StbE
LAFNIVYKKSIQRDLKKISKAEIGRILDRIESELRKRPEAYPALRGRFAGLRKFRVGDYRVVFALMGTDILILRIGHRKEVYKADISPLIEE